MVPETRKKFYHAITLDTCWILQIPKMDFDHVMKDVERKAVNERILYLKTIPEFNVNISRPKLIHLCKHMLPVNLIKGQQLYREGDETKYVYFLRSGELKLSKRILLIKSSKEEENPMNTKSRAQLCEARHHVIGFVSKGQICGVEEVCLNTTNKQT